MQIIVTDLNSEKGCETAINFDSDIPELTLESEPLEVELIIRKL